MRHQVFGLGLSLVSLVTALAESPTVTTADFDKARPANWMVNFGSWEAVGGVLVARQLKEDNHAAASRWQLPLSDGVVKLKLKFAGATAFHLGFDPAPGQLDKQGHLYSLIVTPTQAELKKHRNKADPQSKDDTLATAGYADATNRWLSIELRTEGDRASADITASNGAVATVARLEATDATFHVSKPTVVFRVIGSEVQLDDVEVAVTRPAVSVAKPASAKVE